MTPDPSQESLVVAPGTSERTVRAADGQLLDVPKGWERLAPGDAALTRRVKAAGPSWTVQERKGRKVFSRGVWAPADRIAAIREEVEAMRETEAYAKRKTAAASRRAREQGQYVEDFHAAVLEFLAFAPAHRALAEQLATAVARQATPVGSGTVARTRRIPIAQRAEAAVIAWLRHQTTAYDHLKIARIKGKRREVRRELAGESRRLLQQYRQDVRIDAASCPLQRALTAPRPSQDKVAIERQGRLDG